MHSRIRVSGNSEADMKNVATQETLQSDAHTDNGSRWSSDDKRYDLMIGHATNLPGCTIRKYIDISRGTVFSLDVSFLQWKASLSGHKARGRHSPLLHTGRQQIDSQNRRLAAASSCPFGIRARSRPRHVRPFDDCFYLRLSEWCRQSAFAHF
jgi:hypothetical protein